MPMNSSNNNNTSAGTNMSNMNDVSVPSIPESGNSKSASREKRVNEIYTVNGKAFDYMMNPIVYTQENRIVCILLTCLNLTR